VTPDLDTRLDTVTTALQNVIIPALPAHEVLALEQATLCIAQLALARAQYRHLAEYEALCLAEMTALAGELVTAADGGPETAAAASALRDALDAVGGLPGGPAVQTALSAGADTGPVASAGHRQRNAVAAAVDVLLRATAVDGDPEFGACAQRLVVAHGARQSARDRAWFRDCGLDPDSTTLPSIPELMAEPR
jgi:hypothetical protein